ncbi:hypothetical protein Tco_0777779 [Tanacetum coccineum]
MACFVYSYYLSSEFPEASSTHTTSIHIKRYGHGVDLKSKTTEDIISIGSFIEVLVLNQYVLVRKILSGYQKEARGKRGLVTAQSNANLSPLARFLLSRWQGQASRDLNPR